MAIGSQYFATTDFKMGRCDASFVLGLECDFGVALVSIAGCYSRLQRIKIRCCKMGRCDASFVLGLDFDSGGALVSLVGCYIRLQRTEVRCYKMCRCDASFVLRVGL